MLRRNVRARPVGKNLSQKRGEGARGNSERSPDGALTRERLPCENTREPQSGQHHRKAAGLSERCHNLPPYLKPPRRAKAHEPGMALVVQHEGGRQSYDGKNQSQYAGQTRPQLFRWRQK